MMRLSGQNLRCVRGGREIFAELTVSVAGSEALAITGDNGAGKTSLLRMVAGLLVPANGTFVLEGADDELTLPEQAHYLGHRDALKPSLSLRENLGFWRDFLGGEVGDVAGCLQAVGLSHAIDLPAVVLSAGQRRRLSFARLLAVKRPIWLLDEPLSALDTTGQRLVAGLMTSHLAGGGMILAATHGPLGIEAREMRLG